MKKSNIFGAVFGAALALSGAATAATTFTTPDIIWGSGNTNRGFTVATNGIIELGLRAHLRNGPSGPSDEIDVGIIQNDEGAYLFDSSFRTSSATDGYAMWNFDWSIYTDMDDTGHTLNNFAYLIGYDTNPGAGETMVYYDPVAGNSYCGNVDTANGAMKDFEAPGCAAGDTVAQNSVNYKWLPGDLGDGEYTITLSAFSDSTYYNHLASVSIDVIVSGGISAVPLPAGLPLLLAGLGALGLLRRRKGVPQLAA